MIAVSPDVLPQDGASQSFITVTARDANAQPIRNLTMRTETQVNGTPVDFGTLSARNVVTGSDGKATLVYTAPPSPAVSPDDFLLVDIVVTPFGSDFNNSSQRTASIRLVPQGRVIPPGDLVPAFTVTPTTPKRIRRCCSTRPPARGASPSIPGTSAMAGRLRANHKPRLWHSGNLRRPLDYFGLVRPNRVVRLVDFRRSRRAADCRLHLLATGPLPTQQVFFNASASRPAPGRTLTDYKWDFGDGQSATGVQASHAYALPGSYNVTLVVTDDAGRVATTTKGLTVLSDNPVALITFAPSNPLPGATIAFNGSSSTAVPGRTITGYSWNFGDGTTGSGVAVSKVYPTPGTRNVTLTVTDNTGKSGSTTIAVTVQ